jgi:hypothetical protein
MRFPQPLGKRVRRAAKQIVRVIRLRETQRCMLAAMALLLSTAWVLRGDEGEQLISAGLAAIYWFIVIVLAVGDSFRSGASTRIWRSVALGFLASTLILNVGLYRCPHARYIFFGPYSVTVSGRACHNERGNDGCLANRLMNQLRM